MIVNNCVHVYCSGYQSQGPGAYATVANIDSVLVDSDGYWDAGTPSRVTFPNGGPHLTITFPAMYNPGFPCKGKIRLNGADVGGGLEYPFSGFAANPTSVSGCMPIWLNNMGVGDYIENQVGCFPYEFSPSNRSARTQIVSFAISEYSCHAYATASSGTIPRTYATTVYDPHGMVTASNTFTAQRAGYYLVMAITNAPSNILLCQNGAASPLHGSWGYNTAEGDTRMNAGTQDYVVGWFDEGDYIQVKGSGTVSHRQFVMVFLGGANSCLAYSYNSIDFTNTAPLYTATLTTDSEFIDVCSGHSGGDFTMDAGYHFGLAKIATNGGTFLQNDGVQCRLDGSLIANLVSTGRHQSANQWTAIHAACFDAAEGDIFQGHWHASNDYVEASYTPYTNVFVTDASTVPGPVYSFDVEFAR